MTNNNYYPLGALINKGKSEVFLLYRTLHNDVFCVHFSINTSMSSNDLTVKRMMCTMNGNVFVTTE